MARSIIKSAMRHVFGLARVFCLCAVVVAVALGFGLQQAQAQLSERLFGFGEQLLAWEEIRPHSGVRTMHLNGARFRLLSLSVDGSVGETLDRFEADCEHSGGLLSDLDFSPIRFRQDSLAEGVLACFDTQGRKTTDELLARVDRFTESGDLNELGSLRYVMARSNGVETTALVLWTEGSVPLREMFPKTGDAPGVDPKDAPRMPGTRRLLSAAESDQPYGATLYRIAPNLDAAAWYSTALKKAGWTVLETKRKGMFFASKGTRTLLIRAQKSDGTIGLLELS